MVINNKFPYFLSLWKEQCSIVRIGDVRSMISRLQEPIEQSSPKYLLIRLLEVWKHACHVPYLKIEQFSGRVAWEVHIMDFWRIKIVTLNWKSLKKLLLLVLRGYLGVPDALFQYLWKHSISEVWSHALGIPLNLYIKCVRVKDSCLFEGVRIVFFGSPLVPLIWLFWRVYCVLTLLWSMLQLKTSIPIIMSACTVISLIRAPP